jgi:hypothetical protein
LRRTWRRQHEHFRQYRVGDFRIECTGETGTNCVRGAKRSGCECVNAKRFADECCCRRAGCRCISGSAPISKTEVETLIAGIAAKRGGKYNWQQSIVDLMKLLDLDSGLGARKELAQELGYQGAFDGSAEMNVWLHKQVMDKLAQSGGKVPESLKG